VVEFACVARLTKPVRRTADSQAETLVKSGEAWPFWVGGVTALGKPMKFRPESTRMRSWWIRRLDRTGFFAVIIGRPNIRHFWRAGEFFTSRSTGHPVDIERKKMRMSRRGRKTGSAAIDYPRSPPIPEYT